MYATCTKIFGSDKIKSFLGPKKKLVKDEIICIVNPTQELISSENSGQRCLKVLKLDLHFLSIST
jgi:hypothetical protein